MRIVGLVGGSGTGKGLVSSIFKKYNFISVDTDKVYHELVSDKASPCLAAIRAEFGGSVILPDGTLDRRALAKIVFDEGAEEKREALNKIAHSFVLQEVRHRIPMLREQGFDALLVDAPLLFESGFDKECDIILCVIAKKDTRIKRIIERDGISEEMARLRISAQKSDEYLLSHSDLVIFNDGDISELEAEVENTVKKILNYKKGDK